MRGKLETDTLLTVVLALVVVWLVLAILGQVLDILSTVAAFSNLLGLVVIALIVLWWFDYI